MSRFIMLSLIGILTVFLLLNFMAVIGLGAYANALEKKIEAGHVNADIDFLGLEFGQGDSSLLACKNLPIEVQGLQKMKLGKKSSDEKIKASGFGVGKASYQMAMCYEEKTKACLEGQDEGCLKESLLAYVECLTISGRHFKIEFSEKEKNLYKEILAVKHKYMSGDDIKKLSKEALLIFPNTVFRLKEQLMDINEAQSIK